MGDISPNWDAPFFAPINTVIGILLAILIVASIGVIIWGAIEAMIGRNGNHQAVSNGVKRIGWAVLGLVVGLSAGSLIDWAQVLVF